MQQQQPRHNPALVPGNLLPVQAMWQQFADTLPPGTVLVLIPTTDGPQRAALQATARFLAAAGHRVTTLAAEPVLHMPGIQGQFRLG
jgi:hypothetical protein